MTRRFCSQVLAVVFLLAAASPVLAQGGRAEIQGTVMDQAKEVLPGVTVTAINEGTSQERQAVTGAEGRYVG